MTVLSINMLGRTTINYKGEFIESKISTKAIALICYLISNSDRKISREKLAGYLWADSDDESSRYNLRFCLWSIKRIIQHDEFDEEFIISEKEFCHINKSYDFFCDILFLREIEGEAELSLEQLLELKTYYSGEFLEGLYVNKSPEFNDFVLFERIVYQNKNVELLNRILGKYESLGKYADCVGILKEMLAIDTFNEEFVHLLVQSYYKAGNPNGAINYYQSFEKSLRKNLNVSPSKKLKSFYESMILDKQDVRESFIEAHANIEKHQIIIDTFCLGEIPFFWISDTIGKIVEEFGKENILELEINYISDLASIQNKTLQLYDGEIEIPCSVPPVRIINAFCELLRVVSNMNTILIKINNIENIDSMSKDALQYIKNCSIEGLILKESEICK